jgi:hypothetical protein
LRKIKANAQHIDENHYKSQNACAKCPGTPFSQKTICRPKLFQLDKNISVGVTTKKRLLAEQEESALAKQEDVFSWRTRGTVTF